MSSYWPAFVSALLGGPPALELGVASYKLAEWNIVTTVVFRVPFGTQRGRNEPGA
jgi:hypothetical protein